jgi:hypothetical protein
MLRDTFIGGRNAPKSRVWQMNHNTRVFSLLIVTLLVLAGCSSKPPASESSKAGTKVETIQGKAQILADATVSGDAALNPDGPAAYLWVGAQRYRLFSRTTMDVSHGAEYVVEGINAQKVIDEIGDPDLGKNGFPLQSSCERVVKMAWSNLAFDAVDSYASLLRNRVARYPARPIFLVTRMRPAKPEEGGAASEKKDAAEEKKVTTVSVPAEKQKALLIEGATVLAAPLWEPAGGTVRCKVVIDTEGKISELETGAQFCEAVQWSQFRYQPTVQGGRPAKVKTEVEVRFEPRK